jgi:hypothetical protein
MPAGRPTSNTASAADGRPQDIPLCSTQPVLGKLPQEIESLCTYDDLYESLEVIIP